VGVVAESSGLLIAGVGVTLKLFVLALVVELVAGFGAGFARLARRRSIRVAAGCYVELFRGTSLVVQLFWLYYALPFLGVQLTVWQAAVLGVGLCHGAYASEYVRGAIVAVPRGQYEAATALSMSGYQRMRYVILPQALVTMMPLFGNELILLLKATSVASLITLTELSYAAHSIVVRTFRPVPVFVTVLLIYFALALGISRAMRWLERAVGSWRMPSTAA
jgi:polar amino acid transport system permease protein